MGMGLVDGIVPTSVASNGGFPDYYDGRGGIAQWDIANDTWGENIEPSGQVDRDSLRDNKWQHVGLLG